MSKFSFCLFFKISAFVLFLLTQSLNASLLYDNGQSTHSGGSAIGHFLAADDFKLGSDADLIRASVDISDGPASENRDWDGTVEWWILYNNGGEPGAVLASGIGKNINSTVTSTSPAGFGNDYTVDFEFGQKISIEKNKTYWLALHFQSNFDYVSVSWDFCSSINNNASYSGGELVNGVPDFNGMYGGPGGYDKSFRLYGNKVDWGGPWITNRIQRVPRALAEFCRLEYSYTESPKLICDFPWALTAELEQDDQENGPPVHPFYSGDYSAMGDTDIRSDLYWQLHNIFRRDGNEKTLRKRLNLMADLLEKVSPASYFSLDMKTSILKKLRDSRALDFKVARELMESMNAIELDFIIPPIKTAEAKAGKYTGVYLNGIVWIASRDLKETGDLTLDIRDEIELPEGLQAYITGWPFASYHFNFTGILDESGYFDINICYRGIYFPGDLKNLKLIELDGNSQRDITTSVDTRRQIIMGRTSRLSDYVIMMPIFDSIEIDQAK